jgi:putative flippase GtrA
MLSTREIVLYSAASATALLCDAALLAILVQAAQWHYLPASSVSFVAGALVAYTLSIRFVFPYRRLAGSSAEPLTFVGIGVIGLLLNASIMAAGVELLGLHYMVAKTCAAGVTFFSNYGLRRLLLFTKWAR